MYGSETKAPSMRLKWFEHVLRRDTRYFILDQSHWRCSCQAKGREEDPQRRIMDVEEKAEEAGDRVRGRKMIDCGDP